MWPGSWWICCIEKLVVFHSQFKKFPRGCFFFKIKFVIWTKYWGNNVKSVNCQTNKRWTLNKYQMNILSIRTYSKSQTIWMPLNMGFTIQSRSTAKKWSKSVGIYQHISKSIDIYRHLSIELMKGLSNTKYCIYLWTKLCGWFLAKNFVAK